MSSEDAPVWRHVYAVTMYTHRKVSSEWTSGSRLLNAFYAYLVNQFTYRRMLDKGKDLYSKRFTRFVIPPSRIKYTKGSIDFLSDIIEHYVHYVHKLSPSLAMYWAHLLLFIARKKWKQSVEMLDKTTTAVQPLDQ